jgi:ribosomal protein S19
MLAEVEMKREKKKRTEKVIPGDRNVEKRVHNGKGYVQVKVSNGAARGRRWSQLVKTRKPCTKGANRQRSKGKAVKKKEK